MAVGVLPQHGEHTAEPITEAKFLNFYRHQKFYVNRTLSKRVARPKLSRTRSLKEIKKWIGESEPADLW